MVFFNYSTMQMAAKVVYYGPGLCGKTTNLHYIYGHTSGDSRGEMVSLETETDRTLFFDLLPIDVGSIAGFNTRIQLYTVPGQVFYNTTRKLVLKGVDGVVFVVDSQRAMLQANLDSFKNLEENLAEMGLSVDTIPLVLQLNKRDLSDICTVDELNKALNPKGWPHFEASALGGQGVFETLKGVSKLTLLSLKKRLMRTAESPAASGPRPAAILSPPPKAAPTLSPAPPPRAPAPALTPPPPAAKPAPAPAAVSPPAQPAPPSVQAAPAAPRPATPPPAPAQPAAVPAAVLAGTPAANPAVNPAARARGRSVDVLDELEKLRREAMQPGAAGNAPGAAARPASGAPGGYGGTAARGASRNGRGEVSRNIEMTLKRADFERARRFLVSFQVEDDQNRVMDSVRNLPVEIKDAASLEKLLLHLNIALNAKE
jgi:signal recognition particle receptor subunit beta